MTYLSQGENYTSMPQTMYQPISALEVLVESTQVHHGEIQRMYTKHESTQVGYAPCEKVQYHIHSVQFLSPDRIPSVFVEDAKQVEHYVRAMVEKTTQKPFPINITIQVADPENFDRLHSSYGGRTSKSVMGFSINRIDNVSTIVVRKNQLDAMLLTLAHEIGHVIAIPLRESVAEEAKAFSFELACMKTIVDYNIAGIAASIDQSILFNPAKNGLHDRAFAWVESQLREGKKALKIFFDLITTSELNSHGWN